MRYPKVRELWEALRAVLRGPYTSSFPSEPHVPCPSFRGQPQFDGEHCVGCLACEEICPVGAIAHEDIVEGVPTPRRVLMHYTDTCIFCGQCQAACIADNMGIRNSQEWELSFFDRAAAYETIEKELSLCEMCGSIIGCKDHLLWVNRRLGELAYSNPTLFLTHFTELGVADANLVAFCSDRGRSDRMKILCASCRRRTTLTTAEEAAFH